MKEKTIPPLITLVGYSNAGKTRSLASLIALLTQRGFRVASVKHCHDGFDLDMAGKDTWQHKQAGATTTMMVSENQVGVIIDQPQPLGLMQLVERYVYAVDIVLTEGFSWEPIPKILVASRERFEEEKSFNDPQLIALIDSRNVNSDLPNFAVDQMEELADWLERKYLTQTSGASVTARC